MKIISGIIFVTMIATCCVAVEEIVNDALTHVIVGSGQEGVIYQWKQKTYGYAHAEACYGRVINVYQKATSDINPLTDAVYANFSNTNPIFILTFTPNWYYGFYAVDTDNKGPNGINAAVDFVVSTDETKMQSMIASVPNPKIEIKMSASSGTATLSWASTGHDKTAIYRKDVNKNDYSKEAWFPPPAYYMTGCSAKLWMSLDKDATDNVKTQTHDEKVTGYVQLGGINKDTITLAAVTTMKIEEDPFIVAYDLVSLGAASTTVVSIATLLILLVSILII